MTPDADWQALTPARRRAGLSMGALYVRYLALGGIATSDELTAYLAVGSPIPGIEHDVAVHALNERFLELRDPERLPYRSGAAPT
jgi:hypothetical protein